MIDPATTAGLVTREVRTGSRGGGPTKIALASRTYAGEQDDLWEALTSPERLPRWFLPVSGDLREGGSYQVTGNAHGVGPGAVGVGWDLSLMGLGLHLESGEPVDPAEVEAFTLSAEGVEFVRVSAAGWADAAIADGDDSRSAHDAADRTVAFYTIPPGAEPTP